MQINDEPADFPEYDSTKLETADDFGPPTPEKIEQLCMDVNGHVNAQPDVLSGLDNISQNLVEDEPNEDSSKSSSEFESIYDTYKDKSDEEEVNEVGTEEAPAVFEPAEVSNDELNEMLEDLEVEASGNNSAIGQVSHQHLKAGHQVAFSNKFVCFDCQLACIRTLCNVGRFLVSFWSILVHFYSFLVHFLVLF